MEDSRSRTPPGSGSVPACDRRLEPRIPVRPIEYIEVGESNGGIILDVCEHGVAVSAAQPLGGDQILRLRFQLPRLPDIIETVGEISWIGESKKRAGIRFVDLPESARQQIRRWIAMQTAGTSHVGSTPGTGTDQAFRSLVTTASEQSDRLSPAEKGNALSEMASPSFVTPQEAESENGENLPVAHRPRKPTHGRNPTNERRSQVRKSVNASAYLRLSDGNVGLVANVSETGLSFRAAKALEGERIFVRFQLPDSDQFIESPAWIVWKSPSKKKVGARFVSLPKEAKEQIVQWIGSGTVAKSAVDPAGQTHPVTETSEVGAPPADLTTVLNSVPQAVSAFENSATPEQIDYLRAKPEPVALPAEPPRSAELQLPAFLAPRTPVTADQHLGARVSAASASYGIPDSELPVFYKASPLSAPPKKPSNFWKIATLIILIGGVCFGGGIYFSRNRQISASSYENVNQAPDTMSAPQSSPSERAIDDSSAKPSATTAAAPTGAERSDRTIQDVARQPADKPTSETPQSEPLVGSSDSESSKPAENTVPVADPGSTQFRRRTAATAHKKASDSAAAENTNSANQGAASPKEKARTAALIEKNETSKLESEANARLNQESKPAAIPQPPQTNVASNSQALDSSATAAVRSRAASNPVEPTAVRNLAPSVSFFSRFRSIRASNNTSDRVASGELQIGLLRSSRAPDYPVEAQQRQVQGTVELDVMVGRAGEVQSVRLVKGPAELAGAAANAVRSWQFAPTLLGGQPVETEQFVIFTFRIGT
jgi:TonB family protein